MMHADRRLLYYLCGSLSRFCVRCGRILPCDKVGDHLISSVAYSRAFHQLLCGRHWNVSSRIGCLLDGHSQEAVALLMLVFYWNRTLILPNSGTRGLAEATVLFKILMFK